MFSFLFVFVFKKKKKIIKNYLQKKKTLFKGFALNLFNVTAIMSTFNFARSRAEHTEINQTKDESRGKFEFQ